MENTERFVVVPKSENGTARPPAGSYHRGMSKPNPPPGYYAGLTNLVLHPDVEEVKLGKGLVMRRTFAHFMISNTVAFRPPVAPGKHHGGPWKATTQGDGFDVFTEIYIPSTYKPPHGLKPIEVVRTLTCMLRLHCNPEILFLLEANHSLSAFAAVPDRDMIIRPIESTPHYIHLQMRDDGLEAAASRLMWVVQNWQTAVDLMGLQADFKLAMEAYELSTFVPSHALTLVSLWGALEALFSPSTAELRFRVSVLISSYLCKPGKARLEKQKEIFDLYDKRSAAAHGKPKHSELHLAQSYGILRAVLTQIIESKHVPTKDELNDMLMGVQ
ncbi:hypothetical protein QTH90_21615 [Variovorax sp. J2P1-59]|uniref:hypothetical protein n=1 Tax=Variovorax flavidus TaxID=3053501 RepID=UPI00257829FC|nr:hypothetical protein [Variovorax sp. J2P1-59]MDM0077023.1 hypothetical protein [Variovorax sp. J2P1-59]